MTTRIITYAKRVSAPREIAELTDYLVLKQENSRWRPRVGDTVINWGCSSIPENLRYVGGLRYINHPDKVLAAVDKEATFRVLAENNVPIVQWTKDITVALDWHGKGKTVIQRNTVHGRQGVGIIVCTKDCAPDNSGRLWTKYFPRKDEYRVHVMNGEVIDVQKKRLKTEKRDEIHRQREAGLGDGDVFYVRSYPNGWVFCREGIVCPGVVSEASIAACRALGLDFGAVDVGYSVSRNAARIFEVNTAPGIEGSTVGRYAEQFLKFCGV